MKSKKNVLMSLSIFIVAKKISLFLIILCFIWINCSTPKEKTDIRWVTVEEIARSLENQPPMNVGFDIDDTILFSSPGLYSGMKKYSPGTLDFLSMEKFWEEMNNELDRYSLPKECARKLLELHKKRGDSIFFITGRPATLTEGLTELLAETFYLDKINTVIFTGSSGDDNPKIKPMKEKQIRIFYGDSDSDIQAAQSAGARAIRILRAGNSVHKPFPRIGGLGEEVLQNSEF
jgi:acid phosphatase (class B)